MIEPYRRRIFERALDTFDETGRPQYNEVLCGRAKKNWKSADLVLAALFKLVANDDPGGNQCYILANDEGQAGDDLSLAKKIREASPILTDRLIVRQKSLERADGRGALTILPAQDAVGTHGKTFLFVGFDEIHGYKTWAILEAMQRDPSRQHALTWITSYASIFHRPGIPLFDKYTRGRKGDDPRFLFSWYAADFTTDPDFADAEPEAKANPSRAMGGDPEYLEEQRGRIPAHLFRRLHLNLPGLPEGSAFAYESIVAAVDEKVKVRLPEPGRVYRAFVDMSGGSDDDATLAIGYPDDGNAVIARVENQGQPPPFNPRHAVERFARLCREYGV
ncbi:MAG: hypothetical protein Q8S13_11815, partial [Dehalococcoidia bacterium]|nr:hypothetical protein [Dehalococcoidia bacterium]